MSDYLTIKDVKLEVRYSIDGFWADDKIIFHTNPGQRRQYIIEYLYQEGFIQDPRTPYRILELV